MLYYNRPAGSLQWHKSHFIQCHSMPVKLTCMEGSMPEMLLISCRGLVTSNHLATNQVAGGTKSLPPPSPQ